MPDKEWYKSLTLWGTVLMIAGFVLGQFGYTFTAEQQAQVAQLLVVLATGISELIGVILVITGRRNAGKEIKMLREDVKMARLGMATSPAKESWIDISSKVIGEDATTLFSTGIFFTTGEGKAILSAIKAGAQSEKGRLLLEQFKKMSEKTKIPG